MIINDAASGSPAVGGALAGVYTPVRDDLARAQQIIDAELRNGHPFINELCERIRGYRGKMLRPALLLLTARATGDVRPAHHVLAGVVEIVHLATLVHDDVLDEADLRRQQRTINATHGNETAVLLGDYLISHAYHLCSTLGEPTAALEIARVTNVVCEGELLEIHHRRDLDLTEERYLEIVRRKTAALTAGACALGAQFAGADEGTVRSMREFGSFAGLAFQIVDDVLDLVGDEGTVGKSLRRDLAEGCATLPIIHALARCSDGRQHASHRRRLASFVRGDAEIDVGVVRSVLESNGSIDYALGAAERFVAAALQHLQRLPASDARESLTAMAEFILQRRF